MANFQGVQGALALLLAWEPGLIVQIIRLTSRYQVSLQWRLVWEGMPSIKLALKPILDWIYDDDESKPSPAAGSGDGVIKTGCVTVLVGD
ncbi:hypothetical protein PGS1_12541 [Enterobacter cloacae subsp. cloacae GS1]|nr:hypothetical protein PGS1_12541 [Enterobacter cloacae subsp. cloacae GS1]